MVTLQSTSADHLWSSRAACCCTAAGQAVLPEIQATLARPSREQSTAPTMMKAGCGCLGVVQSFFQFGGLCKLLLIWLDLVTTSLRCAPFIDRFVCKCVVTQRNVVPPAPFLQGIWISYVVVIIAYYGTAICGYAAFGATVSSGGLGGGGRQGYGKQKWQAVGCTGGRCKSAGPASICEAGHWMPPCLPFARHDAVLPQLEPCAARHPLPCRRRAALCLLRAWQAT